MKDKRLVKVYTPKVGQHLRVEKIGRNELCPCGSGKKVKHCCNITESYYSEPNKKGFQGE